MAFVGAALLALGSAITAVAAAAITLSPTSGSPGSSFKISGTGFVPGEMVFLTWDYPYGDRGATLLGQAHSDLKGSFPATPVVVPNNASAAQHQVFGTEPVSKQTASALFQVTGAGPSPTPAPSQSPSPAPSQSPSAPPSTQATAPAGVGTSPSPTPSAVAPLTVTIKLGGAGSGTVKLGPFVCTAQEPACGGSTNLGADQCGGHDCTATVSCAGGTCTGTISPCGDSSSCSQTGQVTCDRDRCEAEMAIAIAKAKSIWYPGWLLALGVIGLLLLPAWWLYLWRRGRRPQPAIVKGPDPLLGGGYPTQPTPTIPAEPGATGTAPASPGPGTTTVTDRCRCRHLLTNVEYSPTPATTEAVAVDAGTGVGWRLAGLVIPANIFILATVSPSPGVMNGAVALSATAEIWDPSKDRKFDDLSADASGYELHAKEMGYSWRDWQAIDRRLTASIIGANPRRFECPCRDDSSTRTLAVEFSIAFSQTLKDILAKKDRARPVAVHAELHADTSIGECKDSKWNFWNIDLDLDRKTGKVSASAHTFLNAKVYEAIGVQER